MFTTAGLSCSAISANEAVAGPDVASLDGRLGGTVAERDVRRFDTDDLAGQASELAERSALVTAERGDEDTSLTLAGSFVDVEHDVRMGGPALPVMGRDADEREPGDVDAVDVAVVDVPGDEAGAAVIVGEEAGSKADKARSLGVTMLDEAGFQALIAQHAGP